ncbi:MAG TPA: 4-alpha-glucanotransferase [Methylophilaceae bacterium]|nr:4-alpha-glucanotransferase [Methylophilaceae bacterium]
MTYSHTRSAGVLLHISSLPSGDLGSDAYRFIDFLAHVGANVWQTLPVNMTHADHSPYQCLSAHAGNPDFICLQSLVNEGLVDKKELSLGREQVFKLAYQNFAKRSQLEIFNVFCQQHQHWLEDFALYVVLRGYMRCAGWNTWPVEYKNRDAKALQVFSQTHIDSIHVVKFTQFLFFTQWQKLKQYAGSKQIQLFGDIPIFVAYDSADVWANPHLFKLDENKEMTVVAGVPPDYFSTTGQRWGNPHYNWTVMAEDGYAWWVQRLSTQSELFDLVRIDHFRGLESAWEIPVTEETAINGHWAPAPGAELLTAIINAIPNIHLIAEDLGIITPEVDALRHQYALPGMKILQFAFGGDDTNPYLPEHIDENSVVYTGTHDNDTTLGWYRQAESHVIKHLHQYLNQESPMMPDALIMMAFETQAYLAIIPMQDILGLDSACRMNTPGTTVDNWGWRFKWEQLTPSNVEKFLIAIKQSGRLMHG